MAKTLETAIEEHVKGVLDECQGNRSEAARQLGIARATLQRMLHRWKVRESAKTRITQG